MSEQITPERQAEAEAIGQAAYRALRADLIEAADRREVDGPLLVEGLEAEAAYQAARKTLAEARAQRHRVLYAMWRANKDPRVVAALMPATVTAATVRAAVVRLAPSQDFEALPLWRTEEEEVAARG
ncbi:hypothetical protein [Streptomyces silvensis]|uniref:Uncharacterized protein n=1 Tax=Streptomyces silvensis TaxID=1765722 RepID=A0A0W7X1Q9_9ACTN|nr:hypothetical protein [Streptomyces silvensis]KUF16682.1 hypothetical protein AT728_40810 [Streptomyces silvensis]